MFDYTKQPGSELLEKKELINEFKPVISIITAFYNGGDFIMQTAYSVLNQTYPFFEWIIVDDGSTDPTSIETLENLEKLDTRIRVFYKENSGPATTRDFGVKHSSASAKYLFILDDDDLIDPRFLEMSYWSMETNPSASWCYAPNVGFMENEFMYFVDFDSNREKSTNLLTVTALINKQAFLEVDGYNVKMKSTYEDWVLWLKLLAKEQYPIRLGDYLFWYRIKAEGEHSSAIKQHSENLKLVNSTSKDIKSEVKALQFPNVHAEDWLSYGEQWRLGIDYRQNMVLPEYKQNKRCILMFIPWMKMGGADKFNLDLLRLIDRTRFEIIVVTTMPCVNEWSQSFDEFATVYNLPDFLKRNQWHYFLSSLVSSHKVDILFLAGGVYPYYALPKLKGEHPHLKVMDYIHMEEWYWRDGGYARDSMMFDDLIDRTLTCNTNSKVSFIENFKKDPAKVEVVYIGVDEKKYDPSTIDKESLKQKFNLPLDKKIIGFIARIADQKRPMLLAEIIKKNMNVNKGTHFVIAGDGPMLDDLVAKLKQYDVYKHTTFLGAVSNTKDFYGACDLTLNCSIKEGLALTSYESLAMGVPVISAKVGGQGELIDDTVGAILPCIQDERDIHVFEYSDEEINQYVNSITRVINDLEKYSNQSRKKVLDGFTLYHMAKNMEIEFNNLLESEPKEYSASSMDDEYLILFLNQNGNEYMHITNDAIRQINIYANKSNIQTTTDREKRSLWEKIDHRAKRIFFSIIDSIKKVSVKLKVYNELHLLYRIFASIKDFIVAIIKRFINLFKRIIKLFIKNK